ncbi:hypothetical protein M3226_05430 [Neobacillus cucumis]|uniref:hypothetical protein n=1 Tax=Neobacillus cucumis TaxID=1740721 RepID=UPI0020401B3D|nr:hypothetical protein [Neobacillus cucumis]MCM3725140.1 hypothetical protein [Neobacillus cucumis]
MKKIFGILLSILVIYVIYYDLTVGTLPASTPQLVDAKVEQRTPSPAEIDTPSFDAEVKPGDTVISIVEHKINKSLPVSIADLIEDFQTLNGGKSPEKIQIGSTYHFPDYSK